MHAAGRLHLLTKLPMIFWSLGYNSEGREMTLDAQAKATSFIFNRDHQLFMLSYHNFKGNYVWCINYFNRSDSVSDCFRLDIKNRYFWQQLPPNFWLGVQLTWQSIITDCSSVIAFHSPPVNLRVCDPHNAICSYAIVAMTFQTVIN